MSCAAAESVSAEVLQKETLQEEILATSKSMNHILDVMPAGVVVIDAEGYVKQANLVAKDMLGEPLEGQLWRTIIARSFRPRQDDGHEISLSDGRRVKLSISPLVEEPGQLILMTDLTETRLLQQRVSHMQRLSSLGKMVASLAHQLRTPLSAATLYAANLLNPTISDDSREQFCQKLQSRLKDLESQINDMLMFAKSGEEQVVTELSLRSLMTEIHEGAEAMLIAKGCKLKINVPEPDLIILGNKTALASAFQNLIHNSLHFSPSEKPISFTAKRSISEPDMVEVIIADEGPGIPEAKMQQIFEPFFTTRTQGTGLGLAVVKSVAQAHKGEVLVSNQKNGGASIGMKLPISRVCSSTAVNKTQYEPSALVAGK
ncbi:PAS domain-containing protein [Alteromonas sp. a30]|nr:ATP-binding protein [Alteromonas sp. a30]MCY7294436.1 PAS domain-containing protein [Alteromonas sp. a30]